MQWGYILRNSNMIDWNKFKKMKMEWETGEFHNMLTILAEGIWKIQKISLGFLNWGDCEFGAQTEDPDDQAGTIVFWVPCSWFSDRSVWVVELQSTVDRVGLNKNPVVMLMA